MRAQRDAMPDEDRAACADEHGRVWYHAIVINNGHNSAQPQCLVQVSLVRYPFGPIVPAGHSRRMRPDCLSNLYTWVR